jgi:shikimate dehydrogenase
LNKVCVIGWPINHSRSPLIHNHWIKSNGLDATYERQPVAPEDLEHFLSTLRDQGYLGCNVTIPHKEAAIPYIDQPDLRVRRIGALNTVFFRDDNSCATSTDGEGFFQNVIAHIPNLQLKNKTITILGAGGAARAIVDRLLEEHPQSIKVVNRNLERAQQLAKDFGMNVHASGLETLSSLLPSTDLLVNTTTLGMTGHESLEIDLRLLPKSAIVADIVYVPLKTKLITDAEALGLRAVPGLGMLLHQAVPGFELWFGIKPAVTKELHDLVARDIDPSYRG